MLIAVVPVIPGAITAIWKIPAIRLFLHRLYYRINGPTYEIQAGGTIRSRLSDSEQKLLTLGLLTAKKVYATASVEAILSNRVMIKADRSRTIRLDLPLEFDDSDDDEQANAPVDDDHGRTVEFQLWGYDGKAARIEALLEKEIGPFINHLITEMQAKNDSRNLWLRISRQGKNPFLQFYLRDVPNAQVNNFQLDLTDVFAGDLVSVVIREDGFRIAAKTPLGLVNSAKSYLSTPALSHRDSG